MKPREPLLITDEAQLSAHVAMLRQTGWFAFDTEFVGEDSYQPEVCLIQTATDDACGIIDPLVGLNLTPVWDLLTDPAIRVLVHAGGQDLSICGAITGRPPTNIFDLQIAAGVLGLGFPLSLSRLALLTTKETIHKSQTLTDWRLRPLNTDQIQYAAEDVRHLPTIYRHLMNRLESSGRTPWVIEDCDRLCRDSAELPRDRLEIHRLRGISALRPRAQAVAYALIQERDALARELNRPPRVVLKDHLLVEIARHGWTDVQKIRTLRGINLPSFAVRRLAQAVETAGLSPLPPEQTIIPDDPDTQEEETLLSLLTAVLRDYCTREKIAYSLLATKDDLRRIVHRHTRESDPVEPSGLELGWRKTAVGQILDRVLRGESAVRVIRQQGVHRLMTQE